MNKITCIGGTLILAIISTGCQSTEGKMKMNRLAQEQSPYLLQHKDNPVDWYPWGEEAFAAAEKQDKPIFPFHRLFYMPLVPCHGTRIVRRQHSSSTYE